MWDERFVEVFRRHPDVVAAYESAHGRFALLLRQTMVPLGVERVSWMAETRAVARAVIAELREAGFTGGAVVLQWLPTADVARIVARWVRRWDGDPSRRAQLTAAVERALADQTFVASRTPAPSPVARAVLDERRATWALDETGLAALKAWYEMMAPCWLAIQPARRRRLVLQTHVWIAERVLADPASSPARAAKELTPDGPLARALARIAPGAEASAWRLWIDVVRADLERALLHPRARSSQAWARWLFLIPYSVPVPRRGRLRVVSGGAPVPQPA